MHFISLCIFQAQLDSFTTQMKIDSIFSVKRKLIKKLALGQTLAAQDPRSQIPDPRSQIPDPRSQIPDPRSQIPDPDPRSQISDPRSQIPDPRSQIPDPRSQIPDPRSQISDPRFQILDPRSQISDPRSQISDFRPAENLEKSLQTNFAPIRRPQRWEILPVRRAAVN